MTTNAVMYYTHFVSEIVSSQLDKLRKLRPEFALFAIGCCPDRSTLDPLATANIRGAVV